MDAMTPSEQIQVGDTVRWWPRHRLATQAFRGVDRTESPVRLPGTKLAPPLRPDGFAQSAIDAAKVAMLAVVPRRFK